MLHQFSRNELAIGVAGLDVMRGSTVAVLGVGGVGSFAAEALARSGIGRIVLIDKDVVDITNINRQLIALLDTIGQPKAELMRERIARINPACEVITLNMFYTEETYERLFEIPLDYMLDASDTISYKIHLAKECLKRGIPLCSSMGAANKMDPIARVIRTKLRKEGIKKGFKAVYSTELPVKPLDDVTQRIVPETAPDIRKAQMPPASNAFVPSVAGLILASVAIRDLLAKHQIKVPTIQR